MKDKDKLEQLLEHNDNNPMALHEIAVIYRDMKDYKKAEEYFIKAKQAGHYSAQFDLEELYANGYLQQLNQEEANEADTNTDKAAPDPNHKPEHSGKNIQTKIIIALCAVIVLLIAVGVVAFMIMSNNNNNSSNNNTSSAVSGVIKEQSSAVSEVENSNSNEEAPTEEPTVALPYDPVTLEDVDTSECWQVVSDEIREDQLKEPFKYTEYIFNKSAYLLSCDEEEVNFDLPEPVELLHYTLKDAKYINKDEKESDYLYIVMKINCTLSGGTKEYYDDKSGGTAYMVMRAKYEVEEDTGIIRLPEGVETAEEVSKYKKDNEYCYVDNSLEFIVNELDKTHSLYDRYEIKCESDETQETTK